MSERARMSSNDQTKKIDLNCIENQTDLSLTPILTPQLRSSSLMHKQQLSKHFKGFNDRHMGNLNEA